MKIFLNDFLKGPGPDTSTGVGGGGCNLELYGIFGE